MATDLEKLVVQMSADIKGFEREMQRARGTANRQASAIEKRWRDMNRNISRSMPKLSIGGAAGLLGVGIGARDFIDTARRLDSLSASFKAITGSQAQAAREMQFVSETADRLGLDLLSAGDAYASLMAATKGTNLEGQATRDIFVAVSNAMATLGKSAADTEGALNAVQQMVSKGKVSAEELRGQLGERLPGAFQAAASALGVTTAELDKMLQAGTVTADDLLPKLTQALNDLYSTGRKDTLSAEINRLNNAVTDLYRTLADVGGIAAAVNVMKSLSAILREIGVYVDLIKSGKFSEALALDQASAGRLKLRLGLGQSLSDKDSKAWDEALGMGAGAGGIGSDARLPLATSPSIKLPGGGNERAAAAAVKGYTQIIAAANERIAQLKIEAETIGMTEREAEAYRFEQEALNRAVEEGIALSPAEREELKAKAAEYAALTEKIRLAREKQDEIIRSADEVRGAVKDFASGFVSDMKAGVSAAEALGNALDRLADKLMDMALDQLVAGLFGKAGGPLAGLIGSLFSTGGVVKAATGGSIRGSGTGTSDSIPAMLSNGEYVVNARQAKKYRALLEQINSGRVAMRAAGGFVGVPSIPVGAAARQSPRPTGPSSVMIDVRGATGNEEVQKLVQAGIRAAIQQYDKGLDRTILGKFQNAQYRFGS